MKASFNDCEFLRELLESVQCNVQVNQPSVFEAEHKSVDAQLPSALPGLLHEGSTRHIEHLLLDIDLYE